MVAIARFDSLRSLAFGGISGAYASVGSAITVQPRSIRIINNTLGDMIFTNDITDAKGKWFLPGGSYVLIDVQANMNPNKDDKYVIPVGTQISVKQDTAPVSGSVYVEFMY